MTACHLIALGELSLGCDQNCDLLLDARWKFAVVALLHPLDVDDCTLGAVWDLEGGVPYLLGLLAEDGVEELELWSRIADRLWSYLTYEDRAWAYIGTDGYDTFCIEGCDHPLGGVRNISCELLWSELGLSDIDRELADMDGGVDILPDDSFADEDSILVVVAVPWNEADKDVPSKSKLAILCCRTICKDCALLYDLTDVDDGLLVETGILVCSLELLYLVGIYFTVELALLWIDLDAD